MRRRRIQRALGLLLIAPLVATVGLSVRADAAPAQTEPGAAPSGGSELGGFTLTGRGNAVRVLYDLPGSLPIGTLVDVSAPEASTRLATGPVAHALSAIGYPGPVVLGGEALLAQGGFESPLPIPDYPLAVEASTSGPTEVRDDETVPGGSMHATTDGAAAEAVTISPANDAAPVLSYGGSRTVSRSTAGTTADTETSVEVSGIVALGGLLRIDAVVSELRATSDGAEGHTSGGTRVVGATLLGQPVEIDATGIRFTDPPEGSDAPLAGVLDPVTSGLEALDAGIADLLGQAGSLNDALDRAGISIRLAEPRATGTGASAERVTEGLTMEFQQELAAGPLGELLSLVPLLPDVPGAPVGPNDLVQIIQARQVGSVSIGRAEAAATAAPAFDLPPLETNIAAPAAAAPIAQAPSPSSGGPASAASGRAPGGGGAPSDVATGPIAASPLVLPGVIGPGVVFAALLGGFLLSLGAKRLPDWALDGTGAAGTTHDAATTAGGDGQ